MSINNRRGALLYRHVQIHISITDPEKYDDMILILFAIVGYLLSLQLIRSASFLERLAYSLVFAVCSFGLVAVNLSLLGNFYISRELLYAIGLVFIVLLIRPTLAHFKNTERPAFSLKESAALIPALALCVFSCFYYSNTEFLLSLASYLQKGEAKCFYMLSFKLVRELNPGILASEISQAYNIISTPGNALFTSTLLPVFGLETFRYLYVFFQVVLYLFVYLIMVRLTKNSILSIAVGLFAALNPYALSVEVLDRNLMALAMSAVFFHTLTAHQNKPLLHGLLLGVTAGLGLRFLHLAFIAPALLFYVASKVLFRAYLLLALGFAVSYIYNIPHLFFHGFHSLGETQSSTQLFIQAFSQWTRTPFLPYPNLIYYLLNAFDFLGLLAWALIGLGMIRSFKEKRLLFVLLALMLLPTFLVLATQRDWIEGDKYRILLMVFLPLMLYLGLGLKSLLDAGKLKANLLIVIGGGAALFLFSYLLGGINGTQDLDTYKHKPIYQKETPEYIQLVRKPVASVCLLPDYHRLFWKTDLNRKGIEEQIVGRTLFGQPDNILLAKNHWVSSWFAGLADKKPKPREKPDVYLDLEIDFQKLATEPDQALTVNDSSRKPLIDFQDEKSLLDLYHKEIQVSWQEQTLPITIMTGKPEFAELGELFIDLNAFIGYGNDEYGFVMVNLINFLQTPESRRYAKASGMTALPQSDQEQKIALRVPQGMTIVIRNWVVSQEKGVPFRIDSWKIDPAAKQPVEFFFLEPESYL